MLKDRHGILVASKHKNNRRIRMATKAMGKSKTTAKSKAKATKKVSRKISVSSDTNSVAAASAILFAGAAVVLLGNIQGQDNIKLLLIGFGAALLVFGGVLLGAATKPSKKR